MIEKKTYADLSDEDILSGKKLEIKVEKKKVVVAASEADCQELLKVIVEERQVADAQKAQVLALFLLPSID